MLIAKTNYCSIYYKLFWCSCKIFSCICI